MLNILIFIISLFVYGIFIRIFGYSYKTFIQIVINAILGLIAMYVLNLIEIPITINWFSIIIIAFLGLPGVVIIIIFSNWREQWKWLLKKQEKKAMKKLDQSNR